MEMLCFPEWSGHITAYGALGGVSLPFSPVRLLCLIGWVYLCLYFAQRSQFSSLVPTGRKSIANFASIIFGPLVLFVLLIVDTRNKSVAGGAGVLTTIGQQLREIVGNLSHGSLTGSKSEGGLKLMDSSGRNIKEIYGHGKSSRQDNQILERTRQIIADALSERASDILIDPKGDSIYTVRYRVDGVLRTVDRIDAQTCQAVVNSVKAVSNMDIAEKRRPQDGAFVAKTTDRTVSFRVASAGVINGEKLSVRVLDQSAGLFTLDTLGLTEKQRSIIENAVDKPSGMVLMCGPTGSGKTTSLYAMLNQIDLYTRNVITVEDPIEYVLANASQIEVNPKADITFAKVLRSILRQDPDVICVGEIRDEETASIALRASQTGHLVLATMHSNSNASALVRLLDLGITSMLLSSGLDLVISQRLLRRLCEHCKSRAELTASQIQDFSRKGINYANIFRANGCERCAGTGYYGRMAVFDFLVIDNRLKADIAQNKQLLAQLRKSGDKKGRSNMYKQGLKKVVSGVTSLEELKRVIG